ncbi:DUF4365 domain-containing protein [Pseudomonas sp. GCM10022186]|uniref:DUF4365 domain-containing protein n=1 Tax=Pseudomonas sp. GCM10022186 TaxID=3252650 RepID=UPI00360D8A03
MKKFNPTERIGVSAVQLAAADEFGWIFREQLVSDVGIDGHLELVVNGEATGKLMAVQVKTGSSYIKKTKSGNVYSAENKHLEYWLNHSLPVLLLIHEPGENKTYWAEIGESKVNRHEKTWSIHIPEKNVFDRRCIAEIEKIFDSRSDKQGVGHYSNSLDTSHFLRHSHVIEVVNEIAGDLQLFNWIRWIEFACCEHIISIPESFVDGARMARIRVSMTIFPEGLNRVKHAAKNMVGIASDLVEKLLLHATYVENQKAYKGIHTYKKIVPNLNYDRDNKAHRAWTKECVALVGELAKAANLFCDIVREELDAEFFLKQGKFLVSDDFSHWHALPEYSEHERDRILNERS